MCKDNVFCICMEVNEHLGRTDVEWNMHSWDVVTDPLLVIFGEEVLQVLVFLVLIKTIVLLSFIIVFHLLFQDPFLVQI